MITDADEPSPEIDPMDRAKMDSYQERLDRQEMTVLGRALEVAMSPKKT